ncbi:response regulator [Rhodoblastus sphagnicola]|uniref:Response regulator n=1 Tax=Rhodoblastus sphagnicola TaxID=333368 RepID=A0A2S6N2B9_9HYPH|nr:response regulator [Rhodoblastus sphagnicola]MBB4197332.1 CheY-like chemotaxis protein [Rhodoblastus sphagnicola]PPQ28765.1 response regulator [Rhodoblastus sphagnicola]
MSVAKVIFEHMPHLRRYARALSGSQPVGDAAVEALLERLIAEPALFDFDEEPLEESFRLFSLVWNARAPVTGICSVSTLPDQRIEAIGPVARQVFLLTAVEGFTPGQASRILDLPEEKVGRLIAEAGRVISAQVASKVAIIEDEPMIAMDLESILSSLGHQVVGPARTHSEAVALAHAEHPGLVLADIRLADGSSGLDAVNEILENCATPVIFITAYPESLLTGERPEPTFLISKPFRAETVKALVSQALFFDEQARPAQPRVA